MGGRGDALVPLFRRNAGIAGPKTDASVRKTGASVRKKSGPSTNMPKDSCPQNLPKSIMISFQDIDERETYSSIYWEPIGAIYGFNA